MKILLFDFKPEGGHREFYNSHYFSSLCKNHEIAFASSFIDDQQYEQYKKRIPTVFNLSNYQHSSTGRSSKTSFINKALTSSPLRDIYIDIVLLLKSLFNKSIPKKQLESLFSLCEHNNFDIVHILFLDQAIYYMAQLRKIKQVCCLSGTVHWPPNSIIRKFLFKKLNTNIEKIFTHDDLSAYSIARSSGIKLSQIHYSYYPMPDSIACSPNIRLTDSINLLFIGQFRRDKGIITLLKALRYISIPYTLTIAGEPTQVSESEIFKYLNQVNININNISVLLGYIQPDDYFGLINNCDVLVLPYTKRFTGQSGPMSEAIKFGKSIIVSNTNSLGHLVEKFNLGISIKPNSPLALAESINELKFSKTSNKDFGRQLFVNLSSSSVFKNQISNYFNNF
jgi:glycosyltransferase involved in cell wall biosynthesis